MLNTGVIMGRLTADPELRYTQSNTPVCSFSIANERDFTNADGERDTDFYDCVAWRGIGEFVSRYFTKGRMIAIDYHLQTRKWQDRDGNNRTSTELVVDNAYFGDSRKETPGGDGYGD